MSQWLKSKFFCCKIYKNQDEFFQLGLIGLWEAYHRFDPDKGAFPAFAQKTVRGKLLRHLYRESRFDQHHAELSHEMLEYISDPFTEEPMQRELILSYCEGLSDKQLTWVMQGIFENKKPREIAEIEGVPVF